MRVERLPFTVYDVLGYLVPGTFALWVAFVFVKKMNTKAILTSNALNIVGPGSEGVYFALFIFLIAAYATGHLVGLLSSISVEKLAVEYFGYPSRFLTANSEKEFSLIIASNMQNYSFKRIRVKFAKLFCWPIWIFIKLLIFTELYTIFMKLLNNNIVSKFKFRLKSLEIEAGKFDDFEWWKGVEFYIINNIPHAFTRMYNYLTIFGFCRNFSFIFIVISNLYAAKFICKIFPTYDGLVTHEGRFGQWHWEIQANWDWSLLIASLGSGLIASLFFLGFLKFYRRYSEEAILALSFYENSSKDAD
jgi:hypothetical protein